MSYRKPILKIWILGAQWLLLLSLTGQTVWANKTNAEINAMDPGLNCHTRVKSCTYQLLNAGRVSVYQLMTLARRAIEPQSTSPKLPEDVGYFKLGNNEGEVSFWSEDDNIRQQMANALIYHDQALSTATAEEYAVEVLVYAFRESDFYEFMLDLAGTGASQNGLLQTTPVDSIGSLASGALVGFAAAAGSHALLRIQFEAAVGDGKAQRWVTRKDLRRNGQRFDFSKTQQIYLDGVTSTDVESAGFKLSGTFFRSRQNSGTFHLGSNSQIRLGTKPNDNELNIGFTTTETSSDIREGVEIIEQPLAGRELTDGVPKVIFDEHVIIEKEEDSFGLRLGSSDSTEHARFIVFLTISSQKQFASEAEFRSEIYDNVTNEIPKLVQQRNERVESHIDDGGSLFDNVTDTVSDIFDTNKGTDSGFGQGSDR